MTTLEIESTVCWEEQLEFLNALDDLLDEHLDNYLVRVKALNLIILKKGTV